MPHHVKVVPVRVRGYSVELDCDVTRVVGYRAVCSCGFRGPSRSTAKAAQEIGRVHRVVHAV